MDLVQTLHLTPQMAAEQRSGLTSSQFISEVAPAPLLSCSLDPVTQYKYIRENKGKGNGGRYKEGRGLSFCQSHKHTHTHTPFLDVKIYTLCVSSGYGDGNWHCHD